MQSNYLTIDQVEQEANEREREVHVEQAMRWAGGAAIVLAMICGGMSAHAGERAAHGTAQATTVAKTKAKWYVAVTERGYVGPFRKEARAIDYCIGAGQRGERRCKVRPMIDPKEVR